MISTQNKNKFVNNIMTNFTSTWIRPKKFKKRKSQKINKNNQNKRVFNRIKKKRIKNNEI